MKWNWIDPRQSDSRTSSVILFSSAKTVLPVTKQRDNSPHEGTGELWLVRGHSAEEQSANPLSPGAGPPTSGGCWEEEVG